MENKRILYACPTENPTEMFLICDINEGRTFEDPLVLFEQPDYDICEINDNGFYAMGGEINTKTLMASYKWGIFPWFPYKCQDTPYWHCPKERFVIFPEKIHITHSLRNLLNKSKYQITINKDFRSVIRHCRNVNHRDKDVMSWLSDELENCFIQLHGLGYAKSIEVWEDDDLVGGFYGFWQNGIFQGESMFSLKPSASQIGLVLLCNKPYIEEVKIKLIDTQFETPTFKRLGGQYIPYREYRSMMEI